MRFVRLLLIPILAAPLALSAQTHTTNVTLSSLRSGGPGTSGTVAMAYGTVCAYAVSAQGSPISVTETGWGLVPANTQICGNVVAGAISGGVNVPDASHSNSATPFAYNFVVQQTDASGDPINQPVRIVNVSGVTGSTFALDAYAPPSTAPAVSPVVGYSGSVPSSCTSPSIWMTTGGAAYSCVAGTYVTLSSISSLNPRGTWSTTTIYARNDTVYYGGSAYWSIAGGANLNQNPASSPSYWQLLAAGISSAVASASDYGAVDDNSTDNTSAFTAMEAAAASSFYLPYNSTGIYRTTQCALSKNYWGPGSITLCSGTSPGGSIAINGETYPSGSLKSIGLDGLLTYLQNNAVDVTWLGNSLVQGYEFISGSLSPANYMDSVPWRLQNFVNQRLGGIGQGGYLSGGAMDNLAKTGTTSYGTHGPVGRDLIMQAGATASFPATYVGSVILSTYNASGGGTVAIAGSDGAWGSFSTASGSGETKSAEYDNPYGVDRASQTITLTCTVGPCEITNIIAATLPTSAATSTFFQMDAQGGYTAASYTSSAVLDSIAFNRRYTFGGGYSIAIVQLLTNEAFNTGAVETVAAFKANTQAMLYGLKLRGIAPIYVIPYLPSPSSTYQTAYAPFAVYRDIAYQICRDNEIPVLDLSGLDVNAGGLYGPDGLHLSAVGYGAVADAYIRGLGLGALTGPMGKFAQPVEAQTAAAPVTGDPRGFVLHDDSGQIQGYFGATNTTSAPYGWALDSVVGEAYNGDYTIDALQSYAHARMQVAHVDKLVADSAKVSTTVPLRPPVYTVSTLPACSAAGEMAEVSDATSPTYLGALTGGGAVFTPVVCNGSAWVSH